MSKTVKNISDGKITVVDVGTVEAGKTIKVPDDFDNANFEEVSKSQERRTNETKKENKITNNK